MDILHHILNLLLPSITIIFLFLFYPFYLLIKLVIYLHKYLHFENVSGKVVLITGASSGIGEHLAYEYAKKGAYLTLVARRKDRLEIVAERSRQLGSANVIILPGDVSILEDCKKFIDDTILHFGKLDHLINNAGIAHPVLFEDYTQIQDAKPAMDINFWGSANITYFAIPHLRKSKGKIIVITSAAANLPLPVASIYSATKAASLRLFETLRVELNPDIKITIVFPGFISTDMNTPHFIEKYGSDFILSESVIRCAIEIFRGVRRGETYITVPSWMKCFILIKNICPEVFEYILNYIFFGLVKPYFKHD